MDNIVENLNDSLMVDSSIDLIDLMELGLDNILDNDILKSIPFVKTLYAVKNVYIGIKERVLIKNTMIFIKAINSGNIDKNKLEKYQQSLKNNHKKAEEELGRVLILLERIIDNQKALILGRLYRAYINQKIDWNMFVEFSEITDRMYINDLNIINLIYTKQLSDTTNRDDLFRVDRIGSLGIVGLTPKAIFVGGTSRKDSYVVLNKVGKLFADIIFDNSDNIQLC